MRILELWIRNKWKFDTSKKGIKKLVTATLLYLVALVIIPAAVYFFSYTQMFIQGKGWHHFKELHYQIWYYQTHLKETHPYQSRPWQWALNARPVWYHVEYGDTTRSDVYAFGNPALFIAALISVLYTISNGLIQFASQQKSKQKFTAKALHVLKIMNTSPLFFLVISYCLVWMPWQVSPRIMFFYHYAPAVPLMSIVLAYWLVALYKKAGGNKTLAVIVWSLIILAFIVWYPHWVGIAVPIKFADTVYFAFQSWQ